MKRHTLLSVLLLALGATAAQAQTSPDSAYTYRIDGSASAGFRVTVTSFSGPFHYRDIPLLRQNCSGNAGSPVAASAEMVAFAQQAGPYHVEFRVPMSAGGAFCEVVGEFDLQAHDLPSTTSGQVDREGPEQGNVQPLTMLPDGINDLQAADPLQLGRSHINWGDAVVLPSFHAVARQGVCYFPYRYVTFNAGPGSAEGTSNNLRIGSASGPLLASNDLPALRPLSGTLVRGQIGLPSGVSTVVLETDAPGYVPESSEANNLRSITVDVQGSCN